MNAEAITKQIMEDIDSHVTLSDPSRRRITYAIKRAVGSVISGLSPCESKQPTRDPSPATVCGWPHCAPAEAAQEQILRLQKELAEKTAWAAHAIKQQDAGRPTTLGQAWIRAFHPDSDDHVPLWLRRELVDLAQRTGLSYYYFCGLYQQGLKDGMGGKPVADEQQDTHRPSSFEQSTDAVAPACSPERVADSGQAVTQAPVVPCCAACPVTQRDNRIAELESALRTAMKQVRLALAVKDSVHAFLRECDWRG